MPTRRHLLFAGATGLAVLATPSVGRRALVGRAFAASPATPQTAAL